MSEEYRNHPTGGPDPRLSDLSINQMDSLRQALDFFVFGGFQAQITETGNIRQRGTIVAFLEEFKACQF